MGKQLAEEIHTVLIKSKDLAEVLKDKDLTELLKENASYTGPDPLAAVRDFKSVLRTICDSCLYDKVKKFRTEHPWLTYAFDTGAESQGTWRAVIEQTEGNRVMALSYGLAWGLSSLVDGSCVSAMAGFVNSSAALAFNELNPYVQWAATIGVACVAYNAVQWASHKAITYGSDMKAPEPACELK